jgi:hypothetical protein
MDRPATSRQSDSVRGTGESGGGKMRTVRRGGRGHADKEKQAAGPAKREEDDIAALKREAVRLREELAIERERTQKLEAANFSVASRLNKAIASIRQLLERQG